MAQGPPVTKVMDKVLTTSEGVDHPLYLYEGYLALKREERARLDDALKKLDDHLDHVRQQEEALRRACNGAR